jgi:hypothetical protein
MLSSGRTGAQAGRLSACKRSGSDRRTWQIVSSAHAHCRLAHRGSAQEHQSSNFWRLRARRRPRHQMANGVLDWGLLRAPVRQSINVALDLRKESVAEPERVGPDAGSLKSLAHGGD